MFDHVLNGGLYLLAFVFVLSLIVIVHEWGHFIVARLSGVKVVQFSLGFGRVLWSRVDKKGTQWQICLWPLGGYVKMLGDEDAASAKTNTASVPESERHLMFLSQPLYKRAAIIIAGPLMNYIFAICVLIGVFVVGGKGVIPAVVGNFLDESPAQQAGMMIGDKIVQVNGLDVTEFSDMLRAIQVSEYGKELVMQVDRNGEMMTFHVTPTYYEGDNVPKIGIYSDPSLLKWEQIGFVDAVSESFKTVYVITADTLTYLGQILFGGRSADGMRGPLGIAEMSGDALKGGALSLLLFIAHISVAIGFMNLLPIPLLDGGHLFFYAIESVIRQPLSERFQNAMLWGGMVLLFSMLLFTMYLDIPRIIQRIFA